MSLSGAVSRSNGETLLQRLTWTRDGFVAGVAAPLGRRDVWAQYQWRDITTAFTSERVRDQRAVFARVAGQYRSLSGSVSKQLNGKEIAFALAGRQQLGRVNLRAAHLERIHPTTLSSTRRLTSVEVAGYYKNLSQVAEISRREDVRNVNWDLTHRFSWFVSASLRLANRLRFLITTKTFQGDVSLTKTWGRIAVTPFLNYRASGYERAGITATGPTWSARLSHSAGLDASATKRIGPVYGSIGYSEIFGLTVGITLHWSLGPQGLTSSAQASAALIEVLAFLDRDRDGVFSSGDLPLEGVTFQKLPGSTDANGRLLIETRFPVDIRVNLESLTDPDHWPADDGRRVVPIPGIIQRVAVPIEQRSK